MSDASTQSTPTTARWRPLERNERRVAGVLAEKAKTTPENYPLTVNSLVNGCNQKSNRFPEMTLDESQVQEALDSLRHAGAVALIQGDGRAEKYRHLLYDWLGVDKAELAVMTELLLRGAQTLGELRGRAARMEPIKDIGQLQPIVESLRQKGLIVFLTPAGRGGVVTHNLYQPQELAKLHSEHGGAADASLAAARMDVTPAISPTRIDGGKRYSESFNSAARSGAPTTRPMAAGQKDDAGEQGLRSEIATLKRELAELREQSDASVAELRRELEDLKSQLGV